MITFTQADQTQLYSPNSTPADKGHLLYLLVAPSGGSTIQVNQTWGAGAAYRGFFLFLDAMPDSIPAFANLVPPVLEQALGHPLDAIANSSFAWITGANGAPSVAALVEVSLDSSQPVVLTSTTINMPLPFYSLPLTARTPIITTAEVDGGIAGFVFTYPAIPPVRGLPAGQPPDGNGLALPLLGGGRGAFQFFGLFNRDAVSDSASDSSDKDLYQVGADPVAPFDYNRTYMTLTNQSYRITETDNQFTITPI